MTDTTPKKNILLGSKIFTIENFFSADECKQLVLLAEKKGFKDSSPSGGGHGRTGREDARTSQFVVLPDEKKMSAELYSRIQPFVGKDLSGLSFSAYLPFQEDAEKWTPVGVNPRIRIYKYEHGQSFPEHIDYKMGRDIMRGGERYRQQTFLSFLIYLNDHSDFQGGETGYWTNHDAIGVKEHCRFLRDVENKPHQVVITPETGKAVIQDQNILHEGMPVTRGVKYILRTDLIHEKKVGIHKKIRATMTEDQLKDKEGEWERIFESSCKNYAD